jgi:tetratricopeptide (TPR) repeat protein
MFFSIVGDHPVFPRQAAHPADGLGADALLARAGEEHQRGQWGMALADLDRACAAAPRNPAAFAQRAEALWGLVDQRGALADDSTAIRLAPDNIDYRFHRAMVLFNMDTSGDLRSLALRDMAFLDKRLPPDDERRRSMAYMYGKYGLVAQELAQWNEWVPVHGAESAILADRCWARVRLDIELPQALEDCDAAIAMDAANPRTYSHRGWARLLQDKPKEALADFDRGAARMYPGVAWALYGRAVAHQRLGQAKAAQADLRAARAQDREIDTLVNTAGLPTASPGTH